MRATRARNFIVMLVAAIVVVIAGIAWSISPLRWCAIALCIGSVLGAEMLNTAIERLADRVEPDRDPVIRDVKDIAAGGVLVVSVASAIVGLTVFWPYVF